MGIVTFFSQVKIGERIREYLADGTLLGSNTGKTEFLVLAYTDYCGGGTIHVKALNPDENIDEKQIFELSHETGQKLHV